MSKDVRPEVHSDEMEAQPLARYHDMQSAVRFPLQLPIAFQGAHEGETRNISANGVLFQTDAEMPVGASVEFTISMSAEVLGIARDVAVNCRGRIVRCFEENQHHWVGVVIDEYGFERAGASLSKEH